MVPSSVAPWSIVLEIPRKVYRAPLIEAGIVLALAFFGATFLAIFGGMRTARRLGRAVASLAEVPAPGEPPSDIAEIADVRRVLDESAMLRAQAEAARHESDERFRATFEMAASGIALVAPEGSILMVNDRMCKITGYSRDELITMTFQEITHPDDLPGDLEYVRQMLAREIETYSLEKRYIRKDGAIAWVNITVSLVLKADGEPDYAIAVVEDIQASRDAEEVLKNAKRLAAFGNWEWDIRTGRHFWSEEIYRIYGRDPALPPAAYPEVGRYFTPESWERLSTAIETALSEGRIYNATPRSCGPTAATPGSSPAARPCAAPTGLS